jgi:hypothetical protein
VHYPAATDFDSGRAPISYHGVYRFFRLTENVCSGFHVEKLVVPLDLLIPHAELKKSPKDRAAA